MLTSRSNCLAVESITVHFDRGFAERPRAFYERLNLRDWLNTLDWLYAESSDRLDELEKEKSEWERDFETRSRVLPDLTPLIMVRIEGVGPNV